MKRRDRAREWLRKIRADVQDLLLDSHVFWEVQEIIRANPRLSAARSYFFHWLMAAHIEATVIGIRRQVKNDRQSVSLRRFLEELAQYPAIVSRAHHVSLCTNLNANLPASIQSMARESPFLFPRVPSSRSLATVLVPAAWSMFGGMVRRSRCSSRIFRIVGSRNKETR